MRSALHTCAHFAILDVGPHWTATRVAEVTKSTGMCRRLGKVGGSYTKLWKLRSEGGKGNFFLFWVVHLLVLGGASPLPVLLGLQLWGWSLSSSLWSYLASSDADMASGLCPYWVPGDAGMSCGTAFWCWG